MKIDNIKQLQAVIRLCKKEGVESIKVDSVEIYINQSATQTSVTKKGKFIADAKMQETYLPGGITEDTPILTDELSPDQLLFYSSDSSQNQQ